MNKQQRSELGAVALKSPAGLGLEPAGQQGSGRVPTPTITTRKTTRVITQGLSRRDLRLLSFVGRFGQVTKRHVHAHIFKDNLSETPADRALKRLTKQGYLARINIPTVGGANGGSGQYVYQVGPEGWKDAFPGKPYKLATAPRYHSLDIASVFVDIDTHMNVVRYETEPESHVTIAYMSIEPDLYVEIDLGDRRRRFRLEIDLGTERPRVLKQKLEKYAYGLEHASDKQRQGWPLVLWVVPDAARKKELDSLIAQVSEESRPMYRTTLFENVVQTMSQ